MNERMNISDSLGHVMDSLNGGGGAKAREEAVSSFVRTHRTLQQCFMRQVIVPILTKLAYDYNAGHCDGRNEASGRLASRMLEAVTDDDLYLPYV